MLKHEKNNSLASAYALKNKKVVDDTAEDSSLEELEWQDEEPLDDFSADNEANGPNLDAIMQRVRKKHRG